MPKLLRIAGIHLGGANTRKTAVVRGSFLVPDNLAPSQLPGLKKSEGWSKNHGFQNPLLGQPLLIEGVHAGIGPSPKMSGDDRLFQLLQDLGPCDLYCIDAPLSSPACTTCALPCPGFLACGVADVVGLRQVASNSARKMKQFLPYMERYLDAFFRAEIEKVLPSLASTYGHDLEFCLSSSRAPLFARASLLKQRLKLLFPEAVTIESNGALSEIGWCNHLNSPFAGEGLSKSLMGGVGVRSAFVRRMEHLKLGMRHANLHSDIFIEIEKSPAVFFATLSALSGWGLFQGLCFFPEETGDFLSKHVLENWICVPKQSVQVRSVN
jgi:hypothetical protein